MQATKFFALGGMQEIGKTTLIIEHEGEIVIIDAGIKFANTIETGVDGIIPDYTYLRQNQAKIKGLFITHGHEDHIGGIPYLIRDVDIKRIYAPSLAIEYIKNKLKDKKVQTDVKFVEITTDAIFKFDKMTIDFWTSQHSIPDSFGVRVKTPNGTIMDTGDFRFDYSPIGNLTDFKKLRQIGQEGVDILISDSTNSMSFNHSPTEAKILEDINNFVKKTEGKVIFTTFASNLNRIKAIIDLAIENKRKISAFGRSMINAIKLAQKNKFIEFPEGTFVDKKEIAKIPDEEVLILSTGSQGEEMAALSRMSIGKHPHVSLKKGDVVIFSSSAIPGNRIKIELLINQLYKLGAQTKENRVDGLLHTSGHAYKEEHNKVFQIVKPKYFIPYHGAYRQSAVHGYTAVENGVKKQNVIIVANGQVVELRNGAARLTDEFINPGPIYIDGNLISKANSQVISERAKLGENGFINVVVIIDRQKSEIVGRTRIVSRGALYVKENKEIISDIQRLSHGGILFVIKNNKGWNKQDIKKIVKSRLQPYFYKNKRRDPFILVSVLEKKTPSKG